LKPSIKTPEQSGSTEHKIYVKGLPWKATEKEVSDFFKSCGKISKVEIPLDGDGRSSGTAYVFFSKRSELESALELDGQYWPGTERWLKILEGIEKPERKSFGGSKPEDCDTVFVGNLPWDVTEEQVQELFSGAGEIAQIRFATGEDGTFRGFGHVQYKNGDDTTNAVNKLQGSMINGKALRVDYAPPRNRDSFGGGRGRMGDNGRGGGRGGRGKMKK
jgi:nucleolin